MPQDYNATLNLPKTDFPMRAGLPKTEPQTLARWEEEKIYEKLMKKNKGKPLYVLHDGPPYANGNIHLGTALNKVLKDIVVRYKNMSGFQSPYVPGWDTHGLPTELKARTKAGVGNSTTISDVELRRICRAFALGYLDDQRTQFKRLGIIGEWDNPYVTLLKEFEAKQIEIFAEMACKGYIYKGLKPVYWCSDCKTALAEAEIEYAEDPCHSIYVKFKVTDDLGKFSAMGVDPAKVSFVIWTTTTWTLPGNVAICVGPRFTYCLIKSNDEYFVMAEELYKNAMQAAGIDDYEIVGTLQGAELEYMKTQHPFLDRTSLVIVGDHVTLESGTGCVHTAPGHGVEDFDVCCNYKELPVIVPVDADGRLTQQAGQFAGLKTEEANKPIAQYLEKRARCLRWKKLNTSTRIAGAAKIRCFSGLQTSGSALWKILKKRPSGLSGPSNGSRAGGKTGLPPWCASVRIGVYLANANGACLSRFSFASHAGSRILTKTPCLLLPSCSEKKEATHGIRRMPVKSCQKGQSAKNAEQQSLIKKRILWMCGLILDPHMLQFCRKGLICNGRQTFTWRVRTSTGVGSSLPC